MLASYLRFDDCVFKDSHDDNSEVTVNDGQFKLFILLLILKYIL